MQSENLKMSCCFFIFNIHLNIRFKHKDADPLKSFSGGLYFKTRLHNE